MLAGGSGYASSGVGGDNRAGSRLVVKELRQVLQYAYNLEGYAWGGIEQGGLELYIQILKDIPLKDT